MSSPSPALYRREGGVLSLSGPALLDLLRAVLDHRVPIRFRARGFSMSPFIKDGDAITVSPAFSGEPGMGDIVAFISPCNDRLVVHRVVGCGEKEWLVRGDNAPEPDGWIPSARMLGRVTRVERDGRDVRLGLGVERIVVAFMSRRGWLGPRVARRRIIKSILGRLLS